MSFLDGSERKVARNNKRTVYSYLKELFRLINVKDSISTFIQLKTILKYFKYVKEHYNGRRWKFAGINYLGNMNRSGPISKTSLE